MKKAMLLLAALCAAPSWAQACDLNDTTAFSCTTTRGKLVEVCQSATHVSYVFGKPHQKPELVLQVPTSELDWSSSGGSGMNFDTITFQNGKTAYALNIESEFGTDDGEGRGTKPSTVATLEVRNGAQTLATLECRPQGLKTQLDKLKATPRPE